LGVEVIVKKSLEKHVYGSNVFLLLEYKKLFVNGLGVQEHRSYLNIDAGFPCVVAPFWKLIPKLDY